MTKVLGLFGQDALPGQRPAGQKQRPGEDAQRLCSQRQGEPAVSRARDADVEPAWTPRLWFALLFREHFSLNQLNRLMAQQKRVTGQEEGREPVYTGGGRGTAS